MDIKQNKVAQWADEHPIAAGFVITLMYIAFRRLTYYIFKVALPQNNVTMVLYEITDVIWPLLMVIAFGRIDIYRKGKFFYTLFLGFVLLPITLYYFFGRIIPLLSEPGLEWQSPVMIIWGITTMLFVGFREESVFRGIVANNLADRFCRNRRGVYLTTVIAAGFFGIMHMQNVFLGQSLFKTVDQSISSFMTGLVLVAIYLRGGNIWAMMLTHAARDLALMVSNLFTKTYGSDATAYIASHKETGTDSISVLLKTVMYIGDIILVLILLRKSKCDEIIKKYEQ